MNLSKYIGKVVKYVSMSGKNIKSIVVDCDGDWLTVYVRELKEIVEVYISQIKGVVK